MQLDYRVRVASIALEKCLETARRKSFEYSMLASMPRAIRNTLLALASSRASASFKCTLTYRSSEMASISGRAPVVYQK